LGEANLQSYGSCSSAGGGGGRVEKKLKKLEKNGEEISVETKLGNRKSEIII